MALPLSKSSAPKRTPCPSDCPNYNNGYCQDHNQMERSRAMGAALFKFAGWSIPIGLMVLIGILSFISQRVDVVEGKVVQHIEGSSEKLDSIHHSVMTIEFNLRRDMKTRGEDFVDLRYKTEENK